MISWYVDILYFISHCVVEAMYVHASDRRLTEVGSTKFFVKRNGDTIIKEINTYALSVSL